MDRSGSMLQRAAHDLGNRLSSQQPTAAHTVIDEKDIVYDRPKKRIGAGAFGTVFEAEWMGVRVAVKRLNKGAHIALDSTDSGVSEGGGSSWNRELGILSAVAHPHVASFYGATQPSTRDGEVRLVFELLFTDVQHLIRPSDDGGPHSAAELAEFTTRISFDEPATKLRIVTEVASAMTYLHAHKPRPVLHRDLKLANVMLTEDTGTSKLIDFGQARAHDSTMSFKTGWAGTPLYMAPEVMNYDAVYNKQVDQFSFGMMVWELWSRAVPYATLRDPPLEKLRELKLTGQPPGDLGELDRAGCPEPVVRVAQECWHPKPDHRPPFDEVYRRLRLHALGIADFTSSEIDKREGDDLLIDSPASGVRPMPFAPTTGPSFSETLAQGIPLPEEEQNSKRLIMLYMSPPADVRKAVQQVRKQPLLHV